MTSKRVSGFLASLTCASLFFGASLHAATVLASYQATGNPTTQGWTATAATLVSTSLVNDGGTSAWKLTDSTASSGVNYLNYASTITDANYTLMREQGWEFKATLRVPGPDEADPSAWIVERNIFVAVVIKNDTSRSHYGLNFGRDLNGNALVGLNGTGTTKSVGTGYHEYAIRYDALAQTTGVYIDGDFWSLINPTTLGAGAVHQALWGDNMAQTQTRAARDVYFKELTLSLVPEPQKALLAMMGISSLLLRRQRRN